MKMSPWIWLAIGGGVLLFAFKASASDSLPKSEIDTDPSTREGFIGLIWTAVQNVLFALSQDAQLLVVAHAAYESGWGNTTAFKQGNNPFNITRGSANVPTIVGADTDGEGNRIIQNFRAYPDFDTAVSDYVALLHRPQYLGAYGALVNADLEGFITGLRTGGYFTQALPTYLANMRSIYTRVLQTAQGIA